MSSSQVHRVDDMTGPPENLVSSCPKMPTPPPPSEQRRTAAGRIDAHPSIHSSSAAHRNDPAPLPATTARAAPASGCPVRSARAPPRTTDADHRRPLPAEHPRHPGGGARPRAQAHDPRPRSRPVREQRGRPPRTHLLASTDTRTGSTSLDPTFDPSPDPALTPATAQFSALSRPPTTKSLAFTRLPIARWSRCGTRRCMVVSCSSVR